MSDMPWAKFFWSDWESDEGLRQCSLAAQGLWMRMLCICAKGDPPGYLAIAGNPLDVGGVAKGAGIDQTEAGTLLDELDQWGVFSRDRKGRIYSRRMVRDIKRSQEGRKNIKKRWSQVAEKKEEKPTPNRGANREPTTQKPEARSQKEKEQVSLVRKKPAKGTRIPDDWLPSPNDIETAKAEGFSEFEIRREAEKFRDYWIARAGAAAVKRDWSATWRNWIRRAAENLGKSPASKGGDPGVIAERRDLFRRKGIWSEKWGDKPTDIAPGPPDQPRLIQ